MKIKGLISNVGFGAILLILLCEPVSAVDFPNFGLYRSPKPLPKTSGDMALTCAALDREITRISPYTYNYRPDFDQDPYVGTSIIAGATWSLVGYGYLAFRVAGDFMEDKRIQTAAARIESLRHLKAEKFCYEDRG
jgi:hypothetical protein